MPIGVIVLMRRLVRPFTEKQIELVETFADQAVIAIENVRLFEEVQARTRELSEALEQQTATSEVLRVISSSPGELEPVFEAMLANATRLCKASFGALLLHEGDGVPARRAAQCATCLCRGPAARAGSASRSANATRARGRRRNSCSTLPILPRILLIRQAIFDGLVRRSDRCANARSGADA